MPSRQNLETRVKPKEYGAPMDTPEPRISRAEERRRKLEKKPTAAERREAIEVKRKRGQEETRRRQKERDAPKLEPEVKTVGKPNRATVEIIREREADIGEVLEEMETGEKR